MTDQQKPANQGAPSPQTQSASGKAIAALVLAIAGFAFCPPLGIAAWIIGQQERGAINAGQSPQAGMGIATAGWIIGIVDTVIFILAVIGLILFLVFAVLLGGAASIPRT